MTSTPEQMLSAIRGELCDFMDAGAGDDHEITVTQGLLCGWFDALEEVSAALRASTLTPHSQGSST